MPDAILYINLHHSGEITEYRSGLNPDTWISISYYFIYTASKIISVALNSVQIYILQKR